MSQDTSNHSATCNSSQSITAPGRPILVHTAPYRTPWLLSLPGWGPATYCQTTPCCCSGPLSSFWFMSVPGLMWLECVCRSWTIKALMLLACQPLSQTWIQSDSFGFHPLCWITDCPVNDSMKSVNLLKWTVTLVWFSCFLYLPYLEFKWFWFHNFAVMEIKSSFGIDDSLPPQALQINEFTGLHFCKEENISSPGVR